MTSKPLTFRVFLEKYFYFSMSILIAVVVTYGFSRTIGRNLIHPAIPRPGLLYLHAAVFYGWLVFFILQSALVRTRHVSIHKTLGWFGAALGAIIIVLGCSTALTMARFHMQMQHRSLVASTPGIPLFDMLCFAATFALAILWRKRPEYHRRLILLATCALSAAGLGRIPHMGASFYLGVDFLILLGIFRDRIVNRRVHTVYRYALPAFFLGQVLTMAVEIIEPPFYQRFMHLLLG